MVEIKYKSSNGNEYSLTGDKMRATAGNFHKYIWKKNVRKSKYGDILKEFTKEAISYSITLNFRGSLESRKQLLDKLRDDFERDISTMNPGTIFFGNYYIKGFVIESETKVSEIWNNWSQDAITIYCPFPFWIQEETFQFLPPVSETQEQSETIKTYDYTYDACVYPTERETPYLINDHYDSCDFKMLVYGPRSQTNITIGENIYHVNYAIQDGEYMVIDSRETAKPGERVYLVRKNGETLNLFDYRNPKYSIFAKIPPGTSAVRCGDAGMDITIYKRRSEPKWI